MRQSSDLIVRKLILCDLLLAVVRPKISVRTEFSQNKILARSKGLACSQLLGLGAGRILSQLL